jgi:tetratricopeptide (TPR) repeat protein
MANSNGNVAVHTAALTRTILAAATAGMALGANADPFELTTHTSDLWGVRQIESGEYQAGIERLERQLGTNPLVSSAQAPVLIDLCAGYVMANELEKAAQVCDKAAGSKWYGSMAYNNRGVLNIARGRYEAAIHDFENAVEAGGSRVVASRNLARAQHRLAAIRAQQQLRMLADHADQREPAPQAPGFVAVGAEDND